MDGRLRRFMLSLVLWVDLAVLKASGYQVKIFDRLRLFLAFKHLNVLD